MEDKLLAFGKSVIFMVLHFFIELFAHFGYILQRLYFRVALLNRSLLIQSGHILD